MGKKTDVSEFSPEEAARRRDAVVRAMIATPPKPHVPKKANKRTARRAAGKKRKSAA